MIGLSPGKDRMEQLPHEIIGKAIKDPDFRRELLNDPDEALANAGFELSEAQKEGLRNLEPDAVEAAIEELAGSVDSPRWA